MTSDAIDASAHPALDGQADRAEHAHAETAAGGRPKRLLDRLAAGTPYAVGFGGQGADWLVSLADLIRTHALDLNALVVASDALLAPVIDEMGPTAASFTPLRWVDAHLAASSASVDVDDEDAPGIATPAIPDADARLQPAYALPGVLLTQAAALRAVRRLGLDPRGAVAAIGHSQGLLAVELVDGAEPSEILALARLLGAASQRVAPAAGLAGETMLHVALPQAEVAEIIATLPASSRLVANVRNGRTSTVVSGTPRGLARLQEALPKGAVAEPISAGAAFHHPEMEAAVVLVRDWAARSGLDADRAERLARTILVEPLDWPAEVARLANAGARWLVDLGPSDLISGFTHELAAAYGIGTLAPATPKGLRELTVVGAAPQQPRGWARFAPAVVRTPDGRVHAETAFTRLTGRSPILLAGMTPTTVDPAIVAAAANGGHWAELAGGGQVTEPVFNENVARLGELLDEGRTAAFNSLYLDPYLWRLQVASQRLVPKARAAGAAFDAVIVTAGVPELDEAAALVEELRAGGIEYVVFKPGTVAQIKSVLKIADAVAPVPVIVQIEGGKAGGHHSWEDLDDLLLATYADLRRRDNVVVCVGGGIGTPEAAAAYISGAWSEQYAEPRMPLDGILVGTAAMACLEATTSPQVKQLLVDTPGTDQWVRAGEVSGGVTSGRSQLGADIHEIDNAAARCGRLLDQVAGDAEAVAERRDEIEAALALTAKPFFGDVTTMTYAQWLQRFLELAGTPAWMDVTIRDRFHELLQRAEARLSEVDHGDIPTLFAAPADVADGAAALEVLLGAYPAAAEVQLHPADLPFFLDVCARPGKPVPFVPVLDGDVRRWYRSDSLWQAHDDRYPADAVAVIPGPVAVAGITRADEPVAELLDRFEAAVVDAVDEAVIDVPGRRRAEGAAGLLGVLLAAPDAVWAGRTVVNPVRRIGDWTVTGDRAENAETGAALVVDGDHGVLTVRLQRGELRLRLLAGDAATGAAIVVDEPAEAMRDLLALAAGGTTELTEGLVAAHAAVTSVGGTRVDAVPDVLVGLAWPTVFATLSERSDVAEGFLDLVHLDHSFTGTVPAAPVAPAISAELVDVTDTEVGRVATVEVAIGEARLTERFAIRGRTTKTPLTDPAVAGGAEEVAQTTRRTRGRVTVTAPTDLNAFAQVTGDHNPIHTSTAVARLAGLGGPIVHGMWLSATAQRALVETLGRPLSGWTARFLAPVRPGAQVDLVLTRVGFAQGEEIVEVQASTLGEDGSTLVMSATARVAAPRTAYVFPGQGIQKQGMGMEGYARSAAAKAIWDRADKHTREVLGFSVLRVVKDNPTELLVDGTWHRHPDGVLFLTQFTQVAMAVLGSAQMAEMIEAGVAIDDAIIAGHSVGEYNALAAVSGVLELEAVVEIVFRRGSVMHTLVPRDAQGRSDYRLAAIRPAQCDIADDEVAAFIDGISATTGEFLQIANLNLRGSQYAIAGTVAGMKALEAEIEKRRAAFGGKAAFVLVPGIDVPFHSRVLADGVADFRQKLDDLLPAAIDPGLLVGRYVPNLVARPFALDRAFLEAIVEVAPAEAISAALEDLDAWQGRDGELCRLLLVELLAWQFASPVRWIETQDLFFADPADGGMGVERLVEIGVGSAPTLANIAAQTLKLPEVRRTLAGPVEVLNLERDANVVFGRDEDEVVVDDEPVAEAAPAAAQAAAPAAPAAPAPAAPAAAAGSVDDIAFTAADATTLLLAWWTKTHPADLAATDSIESLTDGASSRRNQLLMDLGAELGLGAIDGAAEAPIGQLTGQVQGLARSYKPFGPVLTTAIGDHLKKVLGPVGARQSTVTDRVTQTWQLGSGWGTHVLAELALSTRESAISDLDSAIDAAVQSVAGRRGVAVAIPSAGGEGGGTIDAAAAAELTGGITDALVASARTILDRLGSAPAVAATAGADEEARAVVARVEAELGSDWMRLTRPAFDGRRAVLFDDRWASARTDVVRIARGEALTPDLTGAGEAVASIARWHGLDHLAEQALDTTPGTWTDEVAVVTGAGPDSIAEGIVAELLAGGATVVATTSSTSPARIQRFRELYARTARVGATLWVVPANLASYADVDALVDWVRGEQVRRVGPKTEVIKPALHPTLLFPFAAGPASGDLSEAGAGAEAQARILLWSVERLIGAKWGDQRVHVVLPGSPNRGMFGGDGAYGETKAALDAIVAKWSAERGWPERVTLAHAVIGWVAGTGLMGGNDPMVDAAREAGVRVWTPEEMAQALLALCTPEAREQAAQQPLQADFAEGLADVRMRDLAEAAQAAHDARAKEAEDTTETIAALPASPAQLVDPAIIEVARPALAPEDMVVIVGAAELGPWGSSRTRYEAEVGDLSAAGVLELAWATGLVRWDDKARTWRDVASDDAVAEGEIFDRYHDEVVSRCGIRQYADDGRLEQASAPLLVGVFLEQDLTFSVDTEAEARALQASHPEQTRIEQTDEGWTVTRMAGTQIRVPRRLELTRTVGGQVPTGFDPVAWGVPKEMVDSVDRLAIWNLVCTIDAFLASGFTPAELLRWIHPARVANTQGTGMGGMTSMQSLYLDTLLGEPVANDLLQEALPNVVAAHVMQSYVGGYGAMIHPVAACATTAVSIEEGADKIRLGKADFVVAGGYDDLSNEGIIGFGAMSATAETEAMRAQGIADDRFSRANDRRRGGFVEAQGGGTVLLASGEVAARMGLPVLGVVAYAASYADGIHSSIPAPGIGALAAGVGRANSPLAKALKAHGLTADDVAVVSKHDTSTAANDPNESDLHERLAAAIGRSEGNPLHVISQKTLTGHAKGGAAAFQVIGLCQTLAAGVIPPNRSLDCVDPVLEQHPHLVWHREAIETGPLKAGLVTSLGFGHVAGILAIAHPDVFVAALPEDQQEAYRAAARARRVAGAVRVARTMLGEPGFVKRSDRRLGETVEGREPKELEASVLLDDTARLASTGSYEW
ncbi:fatty acid synthase subunit beta domain-containing protein [Nocardioides ultimimeridianus]